MWGLSKTRGWYNNEKSWQKKKCLERFWRLKMEFIQFFNLCYFIFFPFSFNPVFHPHLTFSSSHLVQCVHLLSIFIANWITIPSIFSKHSFLRDASMSRIKKTLKVILKILLRSVTKWKNYRIWVDCAANKHQ